MTGAPDAGLRPRRRAFRRSASRSMASSSLPGCAMRTTTDTLGRGHLEVHVGQAAGQLLDRTLASPQALDRVELLPSWGGVVG